MKKITSKITLGATLLILTLNGGRAQEMPQALKNTMRFEGSWQGEATYTTEGKTYNFPYYFDFKKAADGKGLYADEWFDSPELGHLQAADLLGYNANDGKIHIFTVDNFGTTHDHLCTWKGADHFYMEANETIEHKRYVEKIDVIFQGNDAFTLSLIASLDGKETERLSATFARKGSTN